MKYTYKQIVTFTGFVLGLTTLSCFAADDGPIEDNSFLIEEAYNQEDGVVQFINVLQYNNASKDWNYSFTNEIPVMGQTHQFSYTIPVDHTPSPSKTDLGDVMLNYRYQLKSSPGFFMAPRLSIITPTKDPEGYGLQFNHTVSYTLDSNFVTHYNLGFTTLPKLDIFKVGYGVSGIYLFSEVLNFMLEVVGEAGAGATGVYVSPGLRYAYNFDSGLQIVPGIGAPIGLGAAQGDNSVIFYLSFEDKLF